MKPRTAKILAVFLIFMVIPFSLLTIEAGVKSQTGKSVLDPLKPLWGETLSKNDLSSFKCSGGIFGSVPQFRNNAFGSNGFPGENLKGVVLTSNNLAGVPIGSVCVNQTSMDLSTAAARVIDLWNNFGWNNSVSGVFPSQLFVFLTRNATAPSQLVDYVPNSDPNVVFVELNSINPSGANTWITTIYMQRDPASSIQNDDHGCSNTSGSVYFCGSTDTLSQNWALSTASSYGDLLQMNYTGSSASISPSTLTQLHYGPVGNGGSGGCVGSVGFVCRIYTLPWFNLQSQKYYLGIAVRGASSACPCNNPVFEASFDPQVIGNEAVPTNSGGMEIEQYVPPPISLALDTGGFFGPVIKALVSIGIFIIQSFMLYIGFILQGLALFLDTVGTFFGAGKIGTALVSFLLGLGSWFLNVVGGAFARAADLATGAANFINFLTGFFTNGFWGMITGFVANIAGFLTTLKTAWDGFVYLLSIAGVGIAYFFILDWIFGMWQVRTHGTDGIHKWVDFNELIILKIFHGTYWIADQSAQLIRLVKQTVDPIG